MSDIAEQLCNAVLQKQGLEAVRILRALQRCPSEAHNCRELVKQLPSLWCNILGCFLGSLLHKDLVQSLQDHIKCVEGVRDFLEDSNDPPWATPVIILFCNRLQRLLARMQREHPHNNVSGSAQNLLIKLTRVRDLPYRAGFYGALCSYYVRTAKLSMMKPLLQPATELMSSPEFATKFSLAHRVSLQYHVGRYHLLSGRYEEARLLLSQAWADCYSRAERNKLQILISLIPVMIYHGQFPSRALTSQYAIPDPLRALAVSCKTGDLPLLNATLREYQSWFIKHGLLVVAQKCRAICSRNLFRTVYSIVDENGRLRLEYVQTALQALAKRPDKLPQLPGCADTAAEELEQESQIEEIQCTATNLIAQKLLQGYYSHAQRTLVLYKQLPFPNPNASPNSS
eukprot:TRINITY_DN21675_c0_g1_i1.p1 TRINITY_DN21675_c0_g1~~TRINITY_DN21675_c0_g1_i1.p1  ORF type:complete len:399 (+),score=38.68 TRINITY_DN21675_c0_g1_i1:22-1218(+)